MSSILTNNSAMVALQTLQSINKNLGMTQSEISTGKSVASAKDNSAVWAISKQMESDVNGFQAIQGSLNLGQSTVAVARSAAETVTDLLTDIKGKIVAAQEENVDRSKIQTDIEALRNQIGSVVGSAQFNGLNLLDGSSEEAVAILSSLDRGADGSVSTGTIEVGRQNLSVTEPVTAQSFGDTDLADAAAARASLDAGSATGTIHNETPPGTLPTIANNASQNFTVGNVAEGRSFQIVMDGIEVNVAGGGTATGSRTFEYVASAEDGAADVARALSNQIDAFFGAGTGASSAYSVAIDPNDATTFTVTNGSGTTTNDAIEFYARVQDGGTAGSSAASGGLGVLSTIDVTTDSGATGALTAIDSLIDKAIDAAAAFGSAQGRIETQSSFVGSLTDSLKSGIGTLVDANMEEASARLQALQVQQQLATQSLSIANQAPQSILSLFR